MATTDRGIYYTTQAGNDDDIADLNVITKAMADSAEAALDVLDGEKLAASRIRAGYAELVVPANTSSVPLTLPTSPTGRWAPFVQNAGPTVGTDITVTNVTANSCVVTFTNGSYQANMGTYRVYWIAVAY